MCFFFPAFARVSPALGREDSIICPRDRGPQFYFFRFKRMPVRRRPLVLQAPLNPLEEKEKQKDHSHVHVLLLTLYVSPHSSCLILLFVIEFEVE